MKKVILSFALEAEFVPIQLKGCDIEYVFTGIGKAKAAMNITQAILDENPELVINVGTSGTLNHNVGDIFVCKRFIDRDFCTVKLPGVAYELDFSDRLADCEITRNWISSDGSIGVCNTGDSFVTDAESHTTEGDVVDMEAFAQAVVCQKFNIPLIAVKYVTDVIGQNSVKHWEDKLEDARKELGEWFSEK